jgi:hypothetical protein
LRKLIALVTAFAFLSANLPAQALEKGGAGHGVATHEHVQKALGKLRAHVDRGEGMSAQDRARFSEVADRIEANHATVAGATERLLVLSGTYATPEQRAEIEAKVREELARIGAAHADLASLQRQIYADIQASAVFSAAQKAEVEAIVLKLEDGSLDLQGAMRALETGGLLGDSVSGFVQILCLFLLIVIIGAGFGFGYGPRGGN